MCQVVAKQYHILIFMAIILLAGKTNLFHGYHGIRCYVIATEAMFQLNCQVMLEKKRYVCSTLLLFSSFYQQIFPEYTDYILIISLKFLPLNKDESLFSVTKIIYNVIPLKKWLQTNYHHIWRKEYYLSGMVQHQEGKRHTQFMLK